MLSEPSWSAVISGTGAVYCGIVVVLAVRAGGLGVVALDVVCGALGVAAIVAWQATADPRVALALAIVGDVFLCVPTVVKALRDPASEMGWRFLIAALAGAARRRRGAAARLRQRRLAGLPGVREHDDRPDRAARSHAARRAATARRGAQASSAAASGSRAPAAGCAGSGGARACWRRSRAAPCSERVPVTITSASSSSAASSTASQTVLRELGRVRDRVEAGRAARARRRRRRGAVGLRGSTSASAAPTSSPMKGASTE